LWAGSGCRCNDSAKQPGDSVILRDFKQLRDSARNDRPKVHSNFYILGKIRYRELSVAGLLYVEDPSKHWKESVRCFLIDDLF
jgi:hypothetical protein